MLGEPQPTQGDVHFKVAGFPVRVSPFFWVVSLLLGLSAFDGEPIGTVLSVAVVFVSILVHELGHAVVQQKFGGRPKIVLHGFGGLAICGDCDRSPRSQILISLAGPAAGFLLAGLTALVVAASSGYLGFMPVWAETLPPRALELYQEGELTGSNLLLGDVLFRKYDVPAINIIIRMFLWINIIWGLVNLLPIYPLDGGQVARELFTLGGDPRQGIVWSLQLSLVVAVAVAVLGGIKTRDIYLTIMFGFLAYNNWQTLQAYLGRGPGPQWR